MISIAFLRILLPSLILVKMTFTISRFVRSLACFLCMCLRTVYVQFGFARVYREAKQMTETFARYHKSCLSV